MNSLSCIDCFCLSTEVPRHSAGGSYVCMYACTSSRAHARKYTCADETSTYGKCLRYFSSSAAPLSEILGLPSVEADALSGIRKNALQEQTLAGDESEMPVLDRGDRL